MFENLYNGLQITNLNSRKGKVHRICVFYYLQPLTSSTHVYTFKSENFESNVNKKNYKLYHVWLQIDELLCGMFQRHQKNFFTHFYTILPKRKHNLYENNGINCTSSTFLLQDEQTNRTLTLISKTIQSLGNLVSSRSAQQPSKEQYTGELYKKFCTEKHVEAVKNFLEAISTGDQRMAPPSETDPVLLKDG